jgi:RHS repeat-associated protein
MPGELPPATGYTYAVELSVDQAMEAGAIHVNFSEPLPLYVDNFLNFPVGEIAPLGWYSYELKAWVPDENGYVIEVLSINNGAAVFDVKGNGAIATRAELDSLGITNEELKVIAQLYQAGKTFWRIRASHFTPGDINWPVALPPCGSGEACNPPPPPRPPTPRSKECNSTKKSCTLNVQSRTMGESLSITGTPFSLEYITDRAPGFSEEDNFSRRALRDDKPFPPELTQVKAEAHILGRVIKTFSGAPSEIAPFQVDEYRWDGMDRYGRQLLRVSAALEHIVFYDTQGIWYSNVSDYQRAFAQYGVSRDTATDIPIRGTVSMTIQSNFSRTILSPLQAPSRALLEDALGLWTVSEHHHYDPVRRVLEKGSGEKRSQASIDSQVSLIQSNAFVEDGITYRISGFDVLPNGNILIGGDCGYGSCSAVLFEIDSSGNRTKWPLIELPSETLRFGIVRYDEISDGVYLVDGRNRILYRDRDGRVTWLAGSDNGYLGYGDELDPHVIRFLSIGDILPGRDGILYISDPSAQCVRKLDADGKIRTVAGRCWIYYGAPSPSADPLPVREVVLGYPAGLALDVDDNLVITDTGLRKIYRITQDGSISDYAGGVVDGFDCSESDGTKQICVPMNISLSKNGDIYITGHARLSTSYNHPGFIYKLRTDGNLSIIVGNIADLIGETTYYGPGQEPEVSFNAQTLSVLPGAIAVDGESAVLFKDINGNLRKLNQSLPGFDGGEILVPEPSGRSAYRFDARGKHLETLDTLSGAVLYRFGYTSEGLLSSITDFDGGTTRFERSGGLVVIVSPEGHRTEIILSNDKVTEIRNPLGESWRFEYDNGGLITKATNPNGQSNEYVYDNSKRLLSSHWPNGGGWRLEDQLIFDRWGVAQRKTTLTSGEDRVYEYLGYDGNPKAASNATNPDGSTSETKLNPSGPYSLTKQGDKTYTAVQSLAGDPRFGLMASYTSSSLSQMWGSSKLNRQSRTRWTELYTPDLLFPVKRWGESSWDNSLAPSSQVYDHEEGLWTTISESGRVSKTWVDAIHRPLKTEAPGVPTTLYTYDQGKVTQIEAKPAEGASRFWKNEYDAQGNLSKAFDPLNRAVSYEYDAVGRVTKQTLPDGRSIQQKYDAMGNLIELTTPAGEKHLFNFDVMGDKEGYTPPQISNTDTRYFYNKDRQPVKTVLPGGSELAWIYDQVSGRLDKTAYSEGVRILGYDSGLHPEKITEGSNALYFIYDDMYGGGQRWEGDVNGVFRFYHDNNSGNFNKGFVTRTEAAGSNPAALRQRFTYGPDDEITALSLMKLGSYNVWLEDRKIAFERDADTLRLNKVKGWSNNDQDERAYNAFGELTGYRYHSTPRQYVTYTLDSFVASLSHNEEPVYTLKIEGRLDAAVNSSLQLVPDPHPDDPSPGSLNLSVSADGTIWPSTFTLPGKEGLTRYYTLMASGDTDKTRHYRIGPLTKARNASGYQYLDGFAATLTHNEAPADVLKIEGALDTEASGALRLMPDPHPDDPWPLNHLPLNVSADGAITPNAVDLPGEGDLTRYYTLMASGDTNETRHYRIGPLTKRTLPYGYSYNLALDDFAATLTRNEGPVDVLKIEGTLNTTTTNGSLWLVPDPHLDDLFPGRQSLYVNADGTLGPSTVALPGKEGLSRYYTVMAAGDENETRRYRIGPLTKKDRNDLYGLHELYAIEPGYLYSVRYQGWMVDMLDLDQCPLPLTAWGTCPEHHLASRIRLEDGWSERFVLDEGAGAEIYGRDYIEGRSPLNHDSSEVIGALNGNVYVIHYNGNPLCGVDEKDDPVVCITLQGPGHPTELVMTLPDNTSRTETKLRVRSIPGFPGDFYVVRHEENWEEYSETISIERWHGEAGEVTTKQFIVQLTSPDSPIWAYSMGNFYLENAGEDLLIGFYDFAYGVIFGAFRIKPDGSKQRIELPSMEYDEEEEHWYWPKGLFADGDINCYLYKDAQEWNESGNYLVYYVCKDPSGETLLTKLTPATMPDLWYITLTPKFDPTTRTLYLATLDEDLGGGELGYWSATYRQLWKQPNPVEGTAPWERVGSQTMQALLTINSGTIRDDDRTVRATLTIDSGALKGYDPTATLTVEGGTLTMRTHELEAYRINVERDLIGRVTEKLENLEGKKLKQSYTYDNAGRLIEIKTGENGEDVETWGYDANGNRTHHNGSPIATFDAQDRILSQNGTSYEHNLMGQRTKKITADGTTTYRYDNLGNLRDVVLPDGTQITYVIDPQDRRIGRNVNGNWTHKWIYQDGLNPIAEMDAENRIRKAFVYADKGHVPAYMLTFDVNGNENGQYRIVSDLLGSVRAVYDLYGGYLIQQIDYDVWGNIVNDTNPDFQPFAFAGGLYDQKTKLTRFGARDYDPETGRWTAKDPVLFKGKDTNLYGYVANDPVNGFDPTGLLRRGEGCDSGSWARIQFAERKIREELDKCGECKSGGCIPCSLKDKLSDRLTNTTVTCTGNDKDDCASGDLNGYNMTLYGTNNWGSCGCLASLIYHELLHNAGFGHAGRGKPDAVNAMEGNCHQNLCGVKFPMP